MNAQEQIEELERQIENLRSRAVMELKVKLAEARNRVVDLEHEIAKLSGQDIDGASRSQRKPRISITIKQVVEAIQGGATNYRTVAAKLGCSPANVARKIKADGKKAGIKSTGEKSSFVLSVK